MNEIALPGSPKISPSGRYQLVVFEEEDGDGNLEWGFLVKEGEGRDVLIPAQRWSPRHRLYFLWGEGDRVWVYSGDIGTMIWEPDGEVWQSLDYVNQKGLQPPEFLRKTLPRDFH